MNGEDSAAAAVAIMDRLPGDAVVIPVQALLELFNVLVRKASRSRTEARQEIDEWNRSYETIASSSEVMLAAMGLSADHGLQIFDAVILAAAAGAGCSLLLTEDMQDGFQWNGVTVVNPFAPNRHALLALVLK